MARKKAKREATLASKFPPSPSCDCETCRSYCERPGWWTVAEATAAIEAGYAERMMLEMSPDRRFGVLSPAFRGNEGDFALQRHAHRGCTFLNGGCCELHSSGVQPLECRFCHHDRRGLGPRCHAAIESDWNTPAGRALVTRWGRMTGFTFRKLAMAQPLPGMPFAAPWTG